jgi:hypothetical protein
VLVVFGSTDVARGSHEAAKLMPGPAETRLPEKRKVDSSILSLTTTSEQRER